MTISYMTGEISPYVDPLTLERKRESEKRLEEDNAELEFLEESLKKTDALTQRMVSMLNSFDERLVNLEASILPIHKSTQKLTRLKENIDKTSVALDNIIGYFDLATAEEPIIHKGPQEDDSLIPYLSSIGRIKNAIEFLTQAKLKSAERAMGQLKQLLNKALFQLEALFRKWLVKHSHPIDPTTVNGQAGTSEMPPSVLSTLSTLATYLSSSESEHAAGQPTNYIKTYVDIRSAYLVKSLNPLQQQGTLAFVSNGGGGTATNTTATSQSASGTGGPSSSLSVATSAAGAGTPAAAAVGLPGQRVGGVYQKGGCGFIPYTRCLLRLLKAERGLIHALIPPPRTVTAFESTITSVLDTWVETGEGIISKVKRNTGKHDFSDVFMCFDVLENLCSGLNEFEEVLAGSAKRHEVKDLINVFTSTSVRSFPEFLEDVKSNAVKSSTLSNDGTVHELTSNTLNYLKRLLDYQETLESMNLAESLWSSPAIFSSGETEMRAPTRGYSSLGVSPIGRYINEVLDALITNLETKSKSYNKKTTLSIIFLLNNYHYILKSIRGSKLAGVVGREAEGRVEKGVTKWRDAYQGSWKPLIETLMDVTYVREGALKTSMSKADKETIKEKFKTFNNDFDELSKTQQSYSVPDTELRAHVLKDVKQVLVPMYNRFLERYQSVSFTSNPAKYIKYDVPTLENIINKLLSA